jgi:aryl-phospho-beta-D-glucosidase BglC (GH1 family)
VNWANTNHVRGAVGEVGWPATGDVSQWSAVATQWDKVAREAKLTVLLWAASEWLPPSYNLRIANPPSGTAGPLTAIGPQLQLMLDANKGSRLIGVNDVGGEFGTPAGFSNANPGDYGTAWHLDGAQSLQFLAAQGIRLVRLPIRWERLQPQLNGPLDQQAVAEVARYLTDANNAGLSVVLDLHNFGQYDAGSVQSPTAVTTLHLGSSELPAAGLANVWSSLVKAFGTYPAIAGWDIINEPVALPATDGSSPKTWELASQAVVSAIRKTGDRHDVWIEGYNYSATGSFASLTPRAWIKDPADAVIYEAHTYFDQDRSGQYHDTYATQEKAAVAAAHHAPGAKVCAPK